MPVAPCAVAGMPVPPTIAEVGLMLTVVLATDATISMNGCAWGTCTSFAKGLIAM